MRESDSLHALARAVADGDAIDAPGATSGLGQEDLDLLEELRIIGNISRFHRESRDPLESDVPDSPQSGLPAPAAEPVDAPLFLWGSLRVMERLDGGSFGDVFRAWDPALERDVALKLLRPTTAAPGTEGDAIVREGQLLARVRHTNVMAVYGANKIDGRVGIWGELLRGRTLDEMVRYSGPLSPLEAGLIGDALCRALTAVHRAGLLHRDIKAQNVMREGGGRIVLMDFGLGREAGMAAVPQALELAGTPLYLAPELFRGEPASAQSDIYSVGVLLFFLLTGEFPVGGGSIAELGRHHAAGRRVRLQDLRSDVPAAFAHVIEVATAPDCRTRYATAGALQSALSAAMSVAGTSETRSTEPRVWALLGSLALALMLVGAAAMFAWYRSRQIDMVELTLSAPPGLVFTEGSRNVPAVSPDGSSIAFLATDAQGRMQLWVRSLADPTPRLMPGSEGATRPFWSPDGRSLAYFSGRGLWRVGISGAKPELLAQGTESRGGAWNRKGMLLLSLDPNKGLEAMPAVPNGQRATVTQVNAGRHESQHMWPQFLPDGDHFIFFVLSGDENVEGVYLGALDGRPPTQLVKTHTSAIYASGLLLYTTNGGLFAQPLDVRAGTLTGDPRAMGLAVDATYDSLLMLSVSENATVVYVRPELRQLLWYDLGGHELGALSTPDRYRNPVLSPDGTLLVVERYKLGLSEILAFDLSRAVPPEILPLPARPTCPVWAPDGRLTFAAAPGIYRNIYTTDLRRAQESTLLVESERDKEPTNWSSDGRSLAYVVFEVSHDARNQDLWTLTDDVSAPLVHSPAAEVDGVFSPGGRWVAYVSNEQGEANVYVRGRTTAALYKVSGVGHDPSWISENELVYLDKEAFLWKVALQDDSLAAVKTRRLFRAPLKTPGTSRNNYALSPDRQRVLFNAILPDSGPTTFSVIVNWTALK